VPVLIDGNNLLYAARDVASLRQIDRLGLCRLLGRWASGAGTEVTIVFDGPSTSLAIAQQMRAFGVHVVFSGSRSADDAILDALDEASAAGQYTVVSSDHAIQHDARYHRATAIDSEAFVRDLLRPPGADQSAPDAPDRDEKPEEPAPGETDAWLRRLGFDPDRPSDDTEWLE